jgi:outer membrane immunogenic protein
MHRLVVASLAAAGVGVGFTAVASAADLGRPAPAPVYTKAPVAVPFSWSGFYAGVNTGYGWASDNVDVTTLPSPAAFNENPFTIPVKPKGFVGGGQVGYNWQVSSFVLGLEADIDYAHISGSGAFGPLSLLGGRTAPTTSQTVHQELDWLGTVRGRLGYAADHLLIYGTGGLAVGGIKESGFQDAPEGGRFVGSTSTTRTGWTAGGGLEWAFANTWTAKAEYLHYDLGSDTVTMSRVSAPTTVFFVPSTFHNSGDIVRAGVNYRFN